MHELPNWPAMMDVDMAADYCSLKERSFRYVSAAKGVRPVDMGLGVTRWRKADLDAMIDSLPARGADCPTSADESVLDLGAQALDKARRRAGR